MTNNTETKYLFDDEDSYEIGRAVYLMLNFLNNSKASDWYGMQRVRNEAEVFCLQHKRAWAAYYRKRLAELSKKDDREQRATTDDTETAGRV